MFKINAVLPVLIGFLFFLPLPAESIGFLFKSKKKIYADALVAPNEAVGNKIGNFLLVDQDGKSFEIREFTGKPFIVTFIYTSCPDICPNQLLALGEVVQWAGDRFGRDFRVLTIAFDVENDKPEVLKSYGESFSSNFENWKFVTTENSTDMRNFTRRFGFTYKKTASGYDHLNMLSIIGKDGTIMTQFFGDQYKPEAVWEALQLKTPKKLDLTKFSLVDRFLFFCSYYDPATGEYKLDYILIGQFAIQYLLAFGTILFVTRKQIYSLFHKLFLRTGQTG